MGKPPGLQRNQYQNNGNFTCNNFLTGLKTMKILLDGNICQIMQHHKRTWMCNNWPRNKIVGVRKVTGTK